MSSIRNKSHKNHPTQWNSEPRDNFSGFGWSVFSLLPFFLFLISGFCGLVYEVVWSRMLVLVMGNTTLATSTILASFMAGLSLGSWYWGRFIESRPARPLAVFGGLEAGVGVMALLFPLLIRAIVPMELWLAGSAGWGYYSQIIIRFLFCFALLIVPTFLMGGTFAVIGRQIVDEPPHHQQRFHIVLVSAIADAGDGGMGHGAAQFFRCHLFVGHRLDHVGTGDKHVRGPLGHEDKVGDSRAVDRTTGAGAEDGRNLRHHT